MEKRKEKKKVLCIQTKGFFFNALSCLPVPPVSVYITAIAGLT